jgi:hypothetical protein
MAGLTACAKATAVRRSFAQRGSEAKAEDLRYFCG